MVFPLASATSPTCTAPHQTSPGFSVQVVGRSRSRSMTFVVDDQSRPVPVHR